MVEVARLLEIIAFARFHITDSIGNFCNADGSVEISQKY